MPNDENIYKTERDNNKELLPYLNGIGREAVTRSYYDLRHVVFSQLMNGSYHIGT